MQFPWRVIGMIDGGSQGKPRENVLVCGCEWQGRTQPEILQLSYD